MSDVRHGLVVFILFICLAPIAAHAQYSGEGSRWFRMNSEMRAKIEALGSTPVAGFPVPVLLGVEVSDLTKNFGDPRGGGTRLHEGLDMLVPEGTPVASPTDAVVTRTGNGSGSGIYVRTANPGNESFVYMHLLKIADGLEAGDVLKRGDILGFVGNTGNASGGPAHLHFEVRMGSATDPYPRLTETFALAERMAGIAEALERGGSAYATMYASRFAETFNTAKAQGITIPDSILALLGTSVTPANSSLPPSPSALGVDGKLVFNETNARVVELQEFLIKAESGEDGARLARAGATGYFGPITQAALVEYQRAAELTPTGVVDEATYTQIFALSGEGDSSETLPEGEEEGVPTSKTLVFTRDLTLGMRGEDVRALQAFLNLAGFLVAESAEGSPGQETIYFGSLTQAALSRYQAAMGIAPAVGYFGPITRGHILSL